MSEAAAAELGTKDNPVFFRWFKDTDDKTDWGKIVLMLALTVASGYLAARSQRWGSSAVNPVKTARLAVAKKEISLGHRLQKAGRALEEAGWAAYGAAGS